MSNQPKIKTYAFTIDSNDHLKLASFYAELLNWKIVFQGGDFVIVGAPGTNQGAYPCLTFQNNPDYVPPVWAGEVGTQQPMAHLDFLVEDVEKAVEFAVSLGAKVAEEQFSDDWKVMLDPSGHPFCLCMGKQLFESPDFALK